MKLYYILFTLLFFDLTSKAQKYTNYTTNHGLPSDHVYAVFQDSKGFMWFLTDKGMVKYNGHTFKTFTTKNGLPNNDIWEAFDTPDHKVWYLSKSSVLGYIENDSVVSFPNTTENEVINPLFSVQIGIHVYPTGPNKTYALIDDKWKAILTNIPGVKDRIKVYHPQVNTLHIDYKKDSLYAYNKQEEIIYRTHINGIQTTSGKRGQVSPNLYYWTTLYGYTFFNLETYELTNYTLKEEVGIESAEHIRFNLVDDKIQMTGTGFISFLNEDLKAENTFYFPPELKAHFGYIDQSNTLWLATFNNGVYKLPYVKREVNYAFPQNKIQTFNTVNQTLVIGVYNQGFYEYESKSQSFNQVVEDDQFIYGAFEIPEVESTLYSTFNKLFIGNDNGIQLFNTNKSLVHPENTIRKLAYFNSNIYSVFAFGINKVEPETLKIKQSIFKKGCRDIKVFKKRLILAGANGLHEIINDSIVSINTLKFSKPVLNLTVINDSTLLVNTDGFGSYLTDLKTIYPIKETAFLSVQNTFVESPYLWLATNHGVYKLKPENQTYITDRTYTKEDGLLSNNVNTIHINKTDLIIGTNMGITILPKNRKKRSLFLDVYIQNATYNKTEIVEHKTEIQYQENSITRFTVSNIDYSENEQPFTYTYKLEPIQNTWITVSSGVFNFNDLPPDQYTFRLKSEKGEKVLHFTIRPLYWQTLWFKAFMSLMGIAIIVFLTYRYFKQSQEKRTKAIIQKRQFSDLQLKALRSQMNPHFVFNALSAIQYYINTNDFEASDAYLVKFSKLIRQYFELSRKQEINLEEEIQLLSNYLDLEKLRFKEKLDYEIHVDPQLDLRLTTIPTMLLQPIVENAVNHGVFNKIGNGKVFINFKWKSDNTCIVNIQDNGVGFINTQKLGKQSVTSSEVLKERLLYLNETEEWIVKHTEEEMYPEQEDRGNNSIFLITRILK